MDAARLLEKLCNQGITLFAQGAQLIVKPGDLLTANDETLIREHKTELMALARLRDAETVYRALVEAGPAGLAWREGTPPDWADDRLLAAGEVLYADGRMVNVLGRRYLTAQAPRLPDQWSDSHPPQTTPQTAPSAPRSGIAIDPSPPRQQPTGRTLFTATNPPAHMPRASQYYAPMAGRRGTPRPAPKARHRPAGSDRRAAAGTLEKTPCASNSHPGLSPDLGHYKWVY